MDVLRGLNWLDCLIGVLYLAAIVAFGSWFGRFQKTTRDYFLTGRSVPWWGVCFTIVATETSTLSFIGVPAEILAVAGDRYTGNMTFLQLVTGYMRRRLHHRGGCVLHRFRQRTDHHPLHQRVAVSASGLVQRPT